MPFRSGSRRWVGAVVTAALSCLLVAMTFAPAGSAVAVRNVAGAWTLTRWERLPAGHADQGLASVAAPGGGTRLITRGNADVPAALAARGWWHIGDPGSYRGYLLDAFQAARPALGKLFRLTTPDGHVSTWVHHLVPGEMVNNSFAAPTPDGRWTVSGEWGTVSRLLVFPTPVLNPLAQRGHNLPLAALIRLDRPVRDVQGCAFATASRLICSTNDPGTDLFEVPRQLLVIHLTHPVDGHSQRAVPALLGALPQVSGCGVAETEGIDVAGRTLRVVAHEPGLCRGYVVLFEYTLGSAHAHPDSRG